MGSREDRVYLHDKGFTTPVASVQSCPQSARVPKLSLFVCCVEPANDTAVNQA